MRYFVSSFAVIFALGCDCAGEPFPLGDSGPAPSDAGSDAGPPPDAGPIDPCGDGLDGDDDGRIDEGCECDPGETQRCYDGEAAVAGVGACSYGTQSCAHDFEFGEWDVCVGSGVPGPEDCDAVDNDCDGVVDEGCDCELGATVECYEGPAITEGVGSCIRGHIECVAMPGGGSAFGGCEGSVLPSDEICDGLGDEDCDELIDEGCDCPLGVTQDCYGGAPGTAGVGACRAGSQTCETVGADGSVAWSACTGETRPRTEVCTGGVDEDCDGLADCADPECTTSCCTPYSDVVAVVPAEGEILFLLDRSGSMDWPAVGTARTRWQELETALTTVLPMLDALPMGALTFPRTTGDTERGNCMVASSLDVGIATGTRPAILGLLTTADPRAGDTPTPQAFATASAELMSMPSPAIRFAILLTDGLPEPACGSTVDATVTAIAALRSSGIDTFVVGIVGPDPSGDVSGIPALQAGLNRMADAGGRARAGAIRYYEAVDGPALTSALTAIVASATDCNFALASPPARPGSVEVRFDGSRVPASGWTLSGTALSFSGIWCAQIQAGLVSSITVTDPCAP